MKLVLLLLAFASVVQAVPPFAEVRAEWRSSDPRVLDREGRLLQESRQDFKGRRLDWVPLPDISLAAQRAVIAAEDKRFRSHGGVDWRALIAGAVRSIRGKASRGASTISMQVAAALDPSLRPKGRRRGMWQKWQQIQGARDLETVWDKDQILEAYFNLVTFRGEIRGIGAASRALFDKEPHGLDSAEAALLAALIRAPNASEAAVVARACAIGVETCESIRSVDKSSLTGAYHIRPRVNFAPHLARLVKGHGPEVRTTLDLDAQAFASETLDRYLKSLKDEHVANGAVVVLDNRTGETLAYVGNGESISQVDGVRAKRQAGSTLKPFLYALAFDEKRLTPASLLLDVPLDVPFARGVYRPANYDNVFRGPVSARRSLAESLNIPAVRTLLLLGEDTFVRKLGGVGLESLGEAKKYGPSLALGTADISLWELTNAYRALANGGVWSPAKWLPESGGQEARREFSEGAVYLVSDILSDRESRAATFGWESPLTTKFWSAVKTGTSKDMRDNWCIGFTSEYTVGVWVGNFDGSSMWNVSGASGAAPVWKEVLAHLNVRRPSQRPARPSNVVVHSGENFLVGTEPVEKSLLIVGGRPRIGYPVSGSRFAWDPDIPADKQRIVFEMKGESEGLKWHLDGESLGPAASPAPWRPTPGHHELQLVARNGRAVDSVGFEVRGDEPGNDSPEPSEFQ